MTPNRPSSEVDQLRRKNQALEAENEFLRAREAALKEAQDALRESEARYRSVVKALEDGVVLHDHDGQIIAWNQSAERVLGLTADQLRGRTSLDPKWRCIHPDGSAFPGSEHPGRKTLETGEPFHGVVMGVHKPDGSLSWISINSNAVEQPEGKGKYSVVASFCDITAQVTVERSLREREAQLRHALDEKETLLRELYHRTRNNMQVIRSMIALRARVPGENSIDRVLAAVTDRIRAMELVHHKLYGSQDLSTVELSEYVEELAPLLRESCQAAASNVAIELDLRPVSVPIDTALPVGLLLAELISNALQHAFRAGQNGTLRVSLSEVEPGLIELTVADDGVGFPSDLTIANSERLGLRLVASLVEHQLGGRVFFSSDAGAVVTARFKKVGYEE